MYDKIINTNPYTTDVDVMKSYIDKLNVGGVNIETLPTRQWQEIFEVTLDNKNETITTYDPSIFVCAPGEALGVELTISCSFDITKTYGTTEQIYCVSQIGSLGLMGFIRSNSSTPYNYPALIDQNGKKFTIKYYPGTTDPNATYTYEDTHKSPLEAFNATSGSKAGGVIFSMASRISGYFPEPGYVAYELYSATNKLTGDKEFRGSVYFWPNSVGPDTQRGNGYTSISIKWFKYKEVPPVIPPSWHTIFEGTKNYDASTSTTLTWNPGIVEAPEYKFRISFWAYSSASNGGSGSSVSGSTSYPNTSLYNDSGSSSTSGSKTMNDFEFDALVDPTSFHLINLSASTKYGAYASLHFNFDNRNADKTFKIEASQGADNSCELEITKVEQYY